MSVIKKKPFIEKVYESLTDGQKAALATQINASGNAIVNKTISQVESGIHTYLLKLNEFLIVPCICIKTDDYEVALGYGNKQIINIYNLDTEVGAYTEIKEHCSIEELRRIVFGTGGSGGGITPEDLADMIENGDDEVNVDLNADDTKLLISLHAKQVTITAPSTATSGTLTDEQLSALHESKNSYIVFNNEKYHLNDNGHVSGYLGYSHIGYENSKFILKNITVTESTKGWVLNVKEIGESEDVDFTILLTPLDAELSSFEVNSNNFAEEIAEYVETKNKMPKVAGIIDVGDDQYLCSATQIDIEDDGVVIVALKRSEWYNGDKEELHVKIEMEPDHSGTTDGQDAYGGIKRFAYYFVVNTNSTTTVKGINVPSIGSAHLKNLFNHAIAGEKCEIILESTTSESYEVITAKYYKSAKSIQIKFEGKDVIYYLNAAETIVLIDVLAGSEIIEVHSSVDLPTTAVTDGLVHIVMCDNGLLPDPIDQKAGYIYFEKEE